MSKKTVLRVDTSCDKCKRKILQTVSGLQGVDKIDIDSEKGTMTVTARADPVDVIERTRKAGKRAEVVTIGPPPASSSSSSSNPSTEQQQIKKQAPAAEEKVYTAAAEKRAPEPPATVYVHYIPASTWSAPAWPSYEYDQSVVYHQQDPPPACSIM
uniref:OSJNBa0015K02.17 protein n=1 Tax=Oryza sativa subsp. japonica TaxID=39947 RepID=Q7XQZ7_ORYSJ|nr:OSJNBa0015K02.17 [Oryza sativa Japonica Group]